MTKITNFEILVLQYTYRRAGDRHVQQHRASRFCRTVYRLYQTNNTGPFEFEIDSITCDMKNNTQSIPLQWNLHKRGISDLSFFTGTPFMTGHVTTGTILSVPVMLIFFLCGTIALTNTY